MDRIAFVSRGSGGQPPHPRDIWKKKKGEMPFGQEAA